MSGALTPTLADPSPAELMARELQARLRAVFPEKWFTFAWMPSRADRAWFAKYVQRMPAIALGWDSIKPSSDGSPVFAGSMMFHLALFNKNENSIEGRYFGDRLGPGLLPMVRVACIALQGAILDPPENPFCASGTVEVVAVENLENDEWMSADVAVAGLSLRVRYEEMLPPGMEFDPAGPLELGVVWKFGQVDEITDTIGPIT